MLTNERGAFSCLCVFLRKGGFLFTCESCSHHAKNTHTQEWNDDVKQAALTSLASLSSHHLDFVVETLIMGSKMDEPKVSAIVLRCLAYASAYMQNFRDI